MNKRIKPQFLDEWVRRASGANDKQLRELLSNVFSAGLLAKPNDPNDRFMLPKEELYGKIAAILAFHKADHEPAYWAIRHEILEHLNPNRSATYK